jgi:flagellar motor switch protein FliN/FliY
MGKDGRNPDLEISDLQTSAIGEVMNQLMGAAATALSQEYKTKIAMKAPESYLIQLTDGSVMPREFLNEPLLVLKYNFVIDGVMDSELYELYVHERAKELKAELAAPPPPAPAPSPQPAQAAAPPPPAFGAPPPAYQTPPPAYGAPPPAYQAPPPGYQEAPPGYGYPPPGYGYPPPNPSFQPSPASVRPAEFSPLMPGHHGQSASSLDRIVDIPLRVTVELGSTKLKIKNVLDLNKGSVVELGKQAGEAVDLLVNGKLMAKGEVVVINENFGVRISEIIGPAERLNYLRSD